MVATRVFLVDDHEVVRRGLAEMIGDESDMEVVGEAAGVREALTRIPLVQPDVAVLDVRLPDGDGVDLCRQLRAADPRPACLMLTSYADDEAMGAAVAAGAAGFVLKQIRGTDLLQAIRTLAAGGTVLAPSIAGESSERRRGRLAGDPLASLTDQERTVFELIGEGMTNRQIAERMFFAEKTVKNYVTHLFGKLGVQRRTQIAVIATEMRSRRRQL